MILSLTKDVIFPAKSTRTICAKNLTTDQQLCQGQTI